MADTRYVEQTLYDLERALDDLVGLDLLPAEAARAVVEIVTIRMKWRMGGTQDANPEPDSAGVLRHAVACASR